MAALPNRRHGCGDWIIRVDWRDLAERAMRAVIVIGWFGFVGVMLAAALRGAP